METQAYSSDVRLHLIVEGTVVPLSQIGPGYAILRETIDLPVCDGEIIMSVNGAERRWPVRLTHGAVPFDRTVRTMRCI